MWRTILHVGFWIFAVILAYLAIVFLSAWAEVSGMPRKETFWCSRHGAIPVSEAIRLFAAPMDEPTCPRCFHEKMKRAEQAK